EQRLILALGLSFLIIAFYPYILKTFFPGLVRQPAKVEQQQQQGSAPANVSSLSVAPTPAGQGQATSIRAPKFNANLEEAHIENYDLKISPVGGLIQYLNLNNFAIGKTGGSVLIDAQDGPGSFQVWLEGFEVLSSGAVFQRNRSVEKPGE